MTDASPKINIRDNLESMGFELYTPYSNVKSNPCNICCFHNKGKHRKKSINRCLLDANGVACTNIPMMNPNGIARQPAIDAIKNMLSVHT